MSKRSLFLLGSSIALLLGWLVFESLVEDKLEPFSGIVIPHHDMVASARAAFLAQVALVNSPKTIVLLSPDHFETNKAPITISTKVWQLNQGIFSPDQSLIEKLEIRVDAADFLNEHGITTVLSDLKNNFPEAELVPVMISTRATKEEIGAFVESLNIHCPLCLLVASVDFSHSLQADVADLHDVLTQRALYQLNDEVLYQSAEVDSPGSLTALALWAQLHQTNEFSLFSHTNSGYLSRNLVGEMTTHIMGGYRIGDRVTTLDDDLTIMFGGDVMFARAVHDYYVNGPELALTKGLGDRVFWGSDLSVVNLEGVFSNGGETSPGWYEYPPVFRFASVFMESLRVARINVTSLANNHSADGKLAEYNYTKDTLISEDVSVLEAASTTTTPIIKSVGKTKVALLGYSAFQSSVDISPLISEYANSGHKVVIFAHWGNEYDSVPSDEQQAVARRFIDAGASLVVGSHPHVLQTVDVYKDVPITYSLGNLLFDQEQNGADVGAILGAQINPEGLTLFLAPISTMVVSRFINRDIETAVSAWKEWQLPKSETKYYFPFN